MTTLLAITAATLSAAAWWFLCEHLPEPDPDDGGQFDHDDDPKTPYIRLATWKHTSAIWLTSLTASLVALHHSPLATWAPWLTFTTLGLVVAGIDAVTTWIPLPAIHIAWSALALAIGVSLLTASQIGWAAALGAVVAAAGLGILWTATGGAFGFGDVRWIPLLGAPALATTISTLTAALLIGSLIAIVWVLIDRLITKRRRMVPWTPSYFMGGVAALLLT